MSGGITQLVAIGAQDVWLTGRPEVSFFRNNYKRHTNFAHVVNRQVLQGTVNASGMSSVRFERKGDMLSYVYLTKRTGVLQVPFLSTDIDHIDFLIGGQIIDTQDDTFINFVADPLLCSTENKAVFSTTQVGNTGVFYPFKFWFCENYQSALPLISLQYHDVEARIYWNASVITTNIFECWADFIVLDTMERESLAQGVQNHLIYQVQKSLPSGIKTQNLIFNHPIKFVTSGYTGNCLIGTTQSTSSTTGSQNRFDTILLQINGVDIGEQKAYTPHFDMAPSYYTSSVTTPSVGASVAGPAFLIPFCLDATKLQPTGTLNFSRLDSVRLISSNNFVNTLYAVNYNILKIENGMGGLMYAN
jgi:hypothetical protein